MRACTWGERAQRAPEYISAKSIFDGILGLTTAESRAQALVHTSLLERRPSSGAPYIAQPRGLLTAKKAHKLKSQCCVSQECFSCVFVFMRASCHESRRPHLGLADQIFEPTCTHAVRSTQKLGLSGQALV